MHQCRGASKRSKILIVKIHQETIKYLNFILLLYFLPEPKYLTDSCKMENNHDKNKS